MPSEAKKAWRSSDPIRFELWPQLGNTSQQPLLYESWGCLLYTRGIAAYAQFYIAAANRYLTSKKIEKKGFITSTSKHSASISQILSQGLISSALNRQSWKQLLRSQIQILSSEKLIILFSSIIIYIGNISFYALSKPKLNFGCSMTFKFIF